MRRLRDASEMHLCRLGRVRWKNEAGVCDDAEESIKFWSELWDNPVDHDRNAEWIMTVEKDLGCFTQ